MLRVDSSKVEGRSVSVSSRRGGPRRHCNNVMQHLRPEDLIDLAEGTRAERDVPHLASCEVCRVELSELRATIALAADVEVPAPSPLFWDHFSARVGEAVAREHAVTGGSASGPRELVERWRLWSRPRVLIPGSAIAVAAVVLWVVTNAPATTPEVQTPTETVRTTVVPLPPTLGFDLFSDAANDPDDPSLRLVADLTSDLGWDAAADAGLTAPGSAEHALTHLSRGELQELQRLLQHELGARSVT
jgi:hypothetical protein